MQLVKIAPNLFADTGLHDSRCVVQWGHATVAGSQLIAVYLD
jgi:hypothetical protein